jgi:hypothetical protein
VIEPKADTPTAQETWPRFYDCGVIEDGQALAVLIREWDGTISAVRIDIKQLAD